MNNYPYNDAVTWTFTLTSKAGTLTDAVTLTATVKDPKGNSTSYSLAAATVTHDSTGVYHVEIQANAVGPWTVHVEFTVPGSTKTYSGEDSFVVTPSIFAN